MGHCQRSLWTAYSLRESLMKTRTGLCLRSTLAILKQAEHTTCILVLLHQKVTKTIVRVNSELYWPYISCSKKGVPMADVRLFKALYGMLRAALFFYKRPRNDLENMDFVINPHDPYVTNMTINWSQCTMCWHIYDIKAAHVDEAAVTAFLLHRGKIFGYLGMDLFFGSLPGAIIVCMISTLLKCLRSGLQYSEVPTYTETWIVYPPFTTVRIGNYCLENWLNDYIKLKLNCYSCARDHTLIYI